MAIQFAVQGACNLIVVKQDSATAETITVECNDGHAYSILGGYFQVITGDGAGGVIDVQVGGTSILNATQSTNAAGFFSYILSGDTANFSGAAGADLTIITDEAALVQSTLFLSQNTLDDLS